MSTNFLYDVGRQNLLAGTIRWGNLPPEAAEGGGTDTFRICLVKTGGANYTPSSAHTNMSQVSGFIADTSAGSATAIVTLTGKVITALGAADANDVTFESVTSGQNIGSIVIYKQVDAGNQALNIPLVHIGAATGLPIVSNGGAIIVVFDSGQNRIFRP